MEEKINVAEILKDKPQGTKLYSSACGKCKLEEVDDKSFKISFYNSKSGFMVGGEGYLDKNGKLYDDGECVVFPSKEMRDWSKFAWKKGDVLVNSRGLKILFDRWANGNYTSFYAKTINLVEVVYHRPLNMTDEIDYVTSHLTNFGWDENSFKRSDYTIKRWIYIDDLLKGCNHD